MPSYQEINFENFSAALETTRGTAVTPPSHTFPFMGRLVPSSTYSRGTSSDGTLAEFDGRSKVVYKTCAFETDDAPVDLNYLPFLFSMVVKGGVTPTTPSGATTARLWTFNPDMTSDSIKSATVYWGDPNVKMLQSAYCMAEQWTLSADSTADSGATMKINGQGKFPTKLSSPPTFPSQITGELIVPSRMQVWLDTSSAIGTTEITDRIVKTDWTVPTGVSFKRGAKGPTSDLSFRRTGRAKRHAEANFTVEVTDYAQEYTTWENGTNVKLRIRINGDLIETITGPVDIYSFVELDIWGPLDSLGLGDLEGTNRTFDFSVLGQKDATSGVDYSLKVQNSRTTI
jgi:hypothetical protein